jgi:hypothetical protein
MARDSSPGCMIVVASILILLASLRLVRAVAALVHHQIYYWGWVRWNPTFLNPWQAIVGFGLILVVAIYLFVTALRELRK